jgi:hypothetical protein
VRRESSHGIPVFDFDPAELDCEAALQEVADANRLSLLNEAVGGTSPPAVGPSRAGGSRDEPPESGIGRRRCYSRRRTCGNFTEREDVMADKKKGAEGGAESGKKGADKGADKGAGKKKPVVPEVASEPAPQIAPQIAPRTKSTKIPKLAKKNKSRLPRREKKARQKGL